MSAMSSATNSLRRRAAPKPISSNALSRAPAAVRLSKAARKRGSTSNSSGIAWRVGVALCSRRKPRSTAMISRWRVSSSTPATRCAATMAARRDRTVANRFVREMSARKKETRSGLPASGA